jgi:hypothetical protein
MPPDTAISAIAHSIQLAVAPVFLLTGIAGTLGVMANRLARVVDRARVVETLLIEERPNHLPLVMELDVLMRRSRIVSWAIGLCTATALLISTVVAVLFLSAFFAFDMAPVVAALFIAAMIAFIAALLLLLREILLGTASLRFGSR